MIKPTLEEILKHSEIHPSRVKGCYIFGSRVYGTASDESDWDVILIANSANTEVELKSEKYNIHIIVPDVFKKLVKDNHVKAIECLFAPEWAKIVEFPCEFHLKIKSLRHNFSHTVSNSWVKCKKKLEQGDYYIGIKSLFHSLRIIDFGTQFVKTGEINFKSSNWIWEEIQKREWTWEELKDRFQPLRNSMMTEFRRVTEK